jgi:hypothetical protein
MTLTSQQRTVNKASNSCYLFVLIFSKYQSTAKLHENLGLVSVRDANFTNEMFGFAI